MMTCSKEIRTAAAFAAALAVASSPVSGAGKGPTSTTTMTAAPEVSVTGTGKGRYRIEGSFVVEAPAHVAWAVLTDYGNLASFVSSMRSSSSVRTESGQRLVIQEAVGRAGPFSRKLHVVLDVIEDPPGRIEFHDVGGRSFRSYVGFWVIEPVGTGVRVKYTVEALPRSAPPLFGRSILASNARGLLEQVRLEMLRRERTASAR